MTTLENNLRERCVDELSRRNGLAALPLARELVGLNSRDAEYHNYLGLAEHFSGNSVAAEKAFLNAVQLNKTDGNFLSNLGVLYKDWKRYGEAVATFEKAISLLGSNAHTTLLNLAQCHMDLNQWEAAISAYENAVKENPEYLKGWYELGLANRKLAQSNDDEAGIDAALACFETVTQIEPQYPGLTDGIAATWRTRAEIELNHGDASAAINACTSMDKVLGQDIGAFSAVQNATTPSGVSTYDNAQVLPGSKEWFVLDGNTLHAQSMASTNPVTSPYCQACGREQSIMRRSKVDVFIDEDCFLLGGSDNYYHWLIDYLPRLNSYQHHDRFDEARFLTNDRLQRFQRESLQLLGIGKDRLLQVPKALSQPQTIHCAKLYAAPIALEKMHLKPDALSWLRENLGAACAPLSDTPAGGRHIYISRKDAGTRKVINEKDVATFLASLGFEIIVPGKLSLKKQIAAFADAAVIVGAHGAGLANMVFAPPGARVIEFMGSAAFQQGFMRQLAESCGHRFDRMYCQSQASKTQRQHNAEENFNMFVSLKNLAALLSS